MQKSIFILTLHLFMFALFFLHIFNELARSLTNGKPFSSTVYTDTKNVHTILLVCAQ